MEHIELPLAVELAALAVQMSPPLLSESAVAASAQVLASLAAETVAGASAAAITLVDQQGRRTTTAATSDRARQADQLQYDFGEGPCLQSATLGVRVVAPDLADEPRWPRWAAAARALGLLSVMSTPLVSAERVLGAVKVYSEQAYVFDERSVRLLQGVAETAALLIASAVPVDTSHRVGANLRQALHARDVVQTAKGVVMARDGLDEDAAFQVLVGQARTTNRVLADVAQQVISTRGAERAEGAEGSIR